MRDAIAPNPIAIRKDPGQISSPFCNDQFKFWYHGWGFPALFSDEAVPENLVHYLMIDPGIAN